MPTYERSPSKLGVARHKRFTTLLDDHGPYAEAFRPKIAEWNEWKKSIVNATDERRREYREERKQDMLNKLLQVGNKTEVLVLGDDYLVGEERQGRGLPNGIKNGPIVLVGANDLLVKEEEDYDGMWVIELRDEVRKNFPYMRKPMHIFMPFIGPMLDEDSITSLKNLLEAYMAEWVQHKALEFSLNDFKDAYLLNEEATKKLTKHIAEELMNENLN